LLIVEDEESLRVPVAHLLRRRGFRVIEAPDGQAAIAALRDGGPVIDAVLLDLTLPGMTGREVVAEAARMRPDLKIVLTSAYGEQAAGDALEAPQVKGFIRKPYEVRELSRLLDEVLSRSSEESTSTAGIR
jgi:two-component system, cell cycle sensor histidine kinase and response regulator CckA